MTPDDEEWFAMRAPRGAGEGPEEQLAGPFPTRDAADAWIEANVKTGRDKAPRDTGIAP